jgi:hypothetical protein
LTQVIQKKSIVFTNIKEIKPYDLKYGNNTKTKYKYLKMRLKTYIDSNNVDEHLLYELISIEL